MRNMDMHPKQAVLPDGTIMTGNSSGGTSSAIASRRPSTSRCSELLVDHNECD